ncbi:hypothetical protein [Marinobacter adhaerens]|uniref:hypothetical protein n=1 Tax=Marinobacter adhaerens TaxID=1033846 RepID=UPI003D11F00B
MKLVEPRRKHCLTIANVLLSTEIGYSMSCNVVGKPKTEATFGDNPESNITFKSSVDHVSCGWGDVREDMILWKVKWPGTQQGTLEDGSLD